MSSVNHYQINKIKNTFRKIWRDQKIITIFALLKKLKMRYMPIHIETRKWFSPNGDYTIRGACFAIG
jgi:hypothetical protein